MSKKKVIEPPQTARESYEFRYRLSYGEAYEAFYHLSARGNQKVRTAATAAVGVVALGLLVGVALDRTRVHFLFTALMAVIVMAMLVYAPVLKARRGAARVAKAGGTYQVRLHNTGQIDLPRVEPIPLAGDKNALAIETDNILVVRADSSHTICIPKRVLRPGELEDVRTILKTFLKVRDRRLKP